MKTSPKIAEKELTVILHQFQALAGVMDEYGNVIRQGIG